MVENGELTREEPVSDTARLAARVAENVPKRIVKRSYVSARQRIENGELTRDEAGEMLDGLRRTYGGT